jgi:tetratricopeptide (TPR) repeat protein
MSSNTAEPHPSDLAEPCLTGLPDNAAAQLQIAALAIRDGAEDAACHALDIVLEVAPDHPEALRLSAMLHSRARRHLEARIGLERRIAPWPDYALAHADLGNALQAIGDLDAAFVSGLRSCALALAAPVPRLNLGRNPHQNDDTHEAIDARQRIHALAVALLPTLILPSDALVRAGRVSEADARYRAAIALRPSCGDAWRGTGQIQDTPAVGGRPRTPARGAAPAWDKPA